MKHLKLFEAWEDTNVDRILDLLLKYTGKESKKDLTKKDIDEVFDKLTYKDQEFIKNWFPNKTYKEDIGEYENDYFKINLKDVEHSDDIIIFNVILSTNHNKYEGKIHTDNMGRIHSLDLYDVETGESFEGADDIYKIDNLIEEMLYDHANMGESFFLNESETRDQFKRRILKADPNKKKYPNGFKIMSVIKLNATKLLDPKYSHYVPLTYSSLVRIITFMYILDPNNAKKIEKSELCTQLKKDMEEGFMSDELDAYSRIPTSNMWYDMYIEPAIGVKRNKQEGLQKQDDLGLLKKIWENQDKIYTNFNIIYYINNRAKAKIRAGKEAEEKVIDVINNKGLLYGGWTASEPTLEQDFQGIDIILTTDKGKKSSAQVKNFGKNQKIEYKPKLKEFVLTNTTSNLDVYYSELKNGGKITSFEYLILVDVWNGVMFGIPSRIIKDMKFQDDGITIILDKGAVWGSDIRREDFIGEKKNELVKKKEYKDKKKKDKIDAGKEKWKHLFDPDSPYFMD
jgi:hypothetical protein